MIDNETPETSTASDQTTKSLKDSAPCVLVLGMAGSGKSSFVQVCSTNNLRRQLF